MLNKILSPTDQLKLKKLQTSLKHKHNALYLIAIDTPNLHNLFIKFLKTKITKNEFVIHDLYNIKNSEIELDNLQLNRDKFITDTKHHIFILNYKNAKLLKEKGDFSSTAFSEKFSDNSSYQKIESNYFDTQKIYEMAEDYEKHYKFFDDKQKRNSVREIAFTAYHLMQYKLSLKYFLLLNELVKELNDRVLEAMTYYFIGDNYQNLNKYTQAKIYY